MGWTANSPQEAIEPGQLARGNPVDALSTLLDMHFELSETKAAEEHWPIGRTILFASVASAALWSVIVALVVIL